MAYHQPSDYVYHYSLDDVTEHGEFFHDAPTGVMTACTYLYMWSDVGNPGSYYDSIIAPARRHGFWLVPAHDIVIEDICTRYTGGHGIKMDGGTSPCYNITIRRCDITWDGASLQAWSPSTTAGYRYANGVECGHECHDITVEYNYFYQVYDVAMTQSNCTVSETSYNQYWRYNTIENCEIGWDVICDEGVYDEIHVDNNTFHDLGTNIWHDNRPLLDYRGNAFSNLHRMANPHDSTGETTNCTFKYNTVSGVTDAHVRTSSYDCTYYGDGSLYGWELDYNTYYPDGATMFWLHSYEKTNWSGYRTAMASQYDPGVKYDYDNDANSTIGSE